MPNDIVGFSPDAARELVGWLRAIKNMQVIGARRFEKSPEKILIDVTPDDSPSESSVSDRLRLVKVTGNRTMYGAYSGRVGTAPASSTIDTSSGTLAAADIATVPGADDCTILNADEVGKATHDLTNGTPVVQWFLALRLSLVDENDQPCYVINGVDWEACTT